MMLCLLSASRAMQGNLLHDFLSASSTEKDDDDDAVDADLELVDEDLELGASEAPSKRTKSCCRCPSA